MCTCRPDVSDVTHIWTENHGEVGYADPIPGEYCGDRKCRVKLCPDCLASDPSFRCDTCGQVYCASHAVVEENDLSCECRRIDVDLDDASDCPQHNPGIRPPPLTQCRGSAASI